MDNTLNLENARATERELRLLLEVNNAVVSQLGLRELLKLISPCLRQVIPHDATLLTLHDPESGQLRLQALDLQMFGKVPFEEGVLISMDDTPEGQAITSRLPVLVGPVVDLTRFSSSWVRHAVDNGVRSGCAAPLISHDRTLGALSVVSLQADAFTAADAALLGKCANQIAIAVENALNFERARKIEQQAARERDRLKLLLEINNAIVSHLDLKELVKTISAGLRGIMPHDAAGIALYEPELNLLREYTNVAYKDLDAFREGDTIPLEGTPAGEVFLTGQPMLIRRPNLAKYPADLYSQRPVEASPKSACLAPLISHGRKLGIAGVSSAQEERFTDGDLELFSQITGQIALALENSLNYQKAKYERDRFEMMWEVSNAVSASLDLRELLHATSASIRNHIHHDLAALAIYEEESQMFRLLALDNPPEFLEEGGLIPLEGMPAGLAFKTRQAVWRARLDPAEFPAPTMQQAYQAGLRSGCDVPLISRDRVIGVLGVGSHRESSITQADAETLQLIANQIASAVENALNFERARQAEKDAKRQSERLRLMLKITNAVVSQLDLQELLQVVSSSICEVMGNDSVGVGLFDHESGQLRVFTADYPPGHPLREEGVLIPLEGSPSGLAFTSGQPVFMDKPDLDRFPANLVKRIYEVGYRSGGSIPLIAQGRKLGILGIASKRESAFSDDDKELLCQVANQVAIAVDNALNFERARKAELEVKRQYDQLRLMLEINNAVVSRLDLRELIRVTASCLREVLHHDIVGLSLYDPDTNQLRAYAYDFPDKQFAIEEGTPIPLEGSLGGMAFTSGQAVFINRPRSEETVSDFNKRFTGIGVKSGGCVPLIVHGRKLGVLGVASLREDAFPEDHQQLLAQIASQIAIAVDNALNFERAREAGKEIRRRFERERLMLEINNAVVTQLDLRDLARGASSRLREVLKHDVTGLALYDPETNQFRAYMFDLPDHLPPIEEGTLMPLEGSVGGMAFMSGQPVFMSRPDPSVQAGEFDRRLLEAGVKSGGVVPLIAHDRKLGFLGVGSFREDAFSEADQELLCHIANQIAIAVENAMNFERARKAEQEATRQSDRLSTVLQINNAVVSQLDLHELLQVISRTLRRTIYNDTTGVALYDPESNKLRVVMTDFPEQMDLVEESYLIALEGSAIGETFTSGEPIFTDQFDLERFPSDFTRRSYEAGLRSACNIPLIAHGRKLGALGVASKRPNAFSAEDKELLCQSANQIAIAVENALNFERAHRAEEEAKRQSERRQLLLEINNAVVSHLDLRSLIQTISDSLREVLQHDVTGLSLYDPDTNQLRAYAYTSFDKQFAIEEGTLIPLESSLTGTAFTTGQPVFHDRIDEERFQSDFSKRFRAAGLKSGGIVPLIAHSRKLGALAVASYREAALSEDKKELLCQVANQIAIAVENALAFREIETLKNKLASEKLYLEDEIRTEHNFEELIGSSRVFKRILKQIETVAPTDSAVLIRGETGTGKELIARAIHSLSGRRERTLVKLNCAAIPTGLLESELFGHEKGAFTGAIAQRIGRFELAHRGTLFLDEVGDIPLELQPKLLRVLQEQEFERLGSARTQQVDVRLIAATNCDLEQMVAERKYRSDLFYRLNVFPITIPPLRERAEDIPALARFFTQKYARRMKKRIESIPAETMSALTAYRWPGNVRELEHFIERAVVLTQGSDLEVSLAELKPPASAAPANISTLEVAEREHILRALEETDWVIGGPNGAAARLGMKRTTLQSRMQKLGLSRQR